MGSFELTERTIGGAPHFEDAPAWIYELDNPYLHGVYAPTLDEMDVEDLPVIGVLPDDLYGAYFRNGPNPVYKPKTRYHPFDGDGMVHGVYFRDGKVAYRNKYVHTAALMRERQQRGAVWPGVMGPFDFSLPEFPIKDTSNTDVFVYNGKLMTLWYNAGAPYQMDALSLENRGPFLLQGREKRRLSAHSKVDAATGELLFFDYGDEPPYMTYGVANANGELLHEVPIDLPGPRLPHDIGFTTRFTILHDLPFFHDIDVLRRHKMRVLTFHRDIPARFGIIPRFGQGSEVRWFDCDPCFILHVSNCWEEGDWVVMDGCRSINPMPSPGADRSELGHMLAYMRLEANAYRWQFNMRTGEVREGDIDDLNTEFNKSNELFHGVKSRYSYHQNIPLLADGGHTLRFTGLVKYNNDTGQYDKWDYGPGVFGSEAPFAPKKGAQPHQGREDDGYVVTITTDSNTWKSQCLVFDAQDITRGPVCTIPLPHRVPYGFHSNWARGDVLYL